MQPITNQLLYQLSYVGRGQNQAISTKFRPTQSQYNPDGAKRYRDQAPTEKPHEAVGHKLTVRSVVAS